MLKKMAPVLFVCMLQFGGRQLAAQVPQSARAAQFQIEFLGTGGMVSVHYDARFARRENGLGWRIGLGFSPLGGLVASCNRGTQLSLPIGINYLKGKQANLLEIGAGMSVLAAGGTKIYCPDEPVRFFSENTGFYQYLLFGYRYQPAGKTVSIRAFVTPLFQAGFTPKIWGGASLGLRL